jgi:hypothetical protein
MPTRTTTPQHTTTDKKNHNTQPLLCHLTMANAPPRQALGRKDKELLQKLINKRKIDISYTGYTYYIDRIHHKYFHVTIITFDANSDVTQDPVILRTT